MSNDVTVSVATVADDAPRNGSEPTGVPGYEILEEVGRGGMGVVFRARQVSLNRVVALKMVLGGRGGASILDRFRTEAEAVGRLQHANIVQVFEIGEHDGCPFYTLEFCPNGNLARKLGGKPLTAGEAVELVEDLARAMTAVHRAGIVHRDLKPQNVLMSADWTPKVTDFGCAKTEHGSHTQTGAIFGTPGYMAPEQAEGRNKEVGPAADVWALGAILYECLTGRPPFLAANPVETLRQVVEQDPPPPRLLNRFIDPELEKIVLKCLEKDPALRYQSAAELAEDLRRHRDGEPIHARSVNLLERLQRELHRSQHETKFGPWGTGLMLLGVLVWAVHVSTSFLLIGGVAEWPAFWIPRGLFFVLFGVWLWKYGFGNGFLPTSAIERLLWAVWLGYLLAFAAVFWVARAQGHGHLEMYGAGMALSGLAWFAMGGSIWGGCYLIGLLFLAGAPVMAYTLDGSPWAPATFGAAWGVTLLVVGGRYRRLGRLAAENRNPAG
ncbi:MAG TPA: protein kinase [Gemmataceae bacterium]|nr:protein kinase [Gemmataceae bacterium]